MDIRRALLAVAVALAATLALSPAATAGIWTPYASGTTADITAVDYRAPDQLWYGTAGGAIFKNGVQQASFPGFSINDIALNPAGTRGIAVANGGKIYKFDGATWSPVSLTNVSRNHTCNGVPSALNYTPTGNFYAVSWSSDTVAWVVGAEKGMVLQTTNGGTTFAELSRQADGSCYVNGGPLTDVATIPGTQIVWIVSDNFGARFISSNGLTSSASQQNSTSANCYDKRPRLALDTGNPNRSFVSDRCTGSLQWGFSEDGGVNYELSMDIPNGGANSLTGLNDTVIAGGAALAVGNGGAILVSLTGRQGYFQRADGTDATNDWLAVDKFDANNAAVVGKGGRIVLSSQAAAIPDLVAPAGTISGPTTTSAGTPTTYTANVADNAGGSGVDPAGFAWSATGIPGATGNPASITFPSPGTYLLKVTFRDLAGNAGEATLTVTVGKGATPGTASKTVSGGTITLTGPRACVATGRRLSAAFKFRKRRGSATRVLKVEFFIDGKRKKTDRRAPYRQKLSTKGLKRGSRHTLRTRVTLRLAGGARTRTSLTTTFRIC